MTSPIQWTGDFYPNARGYAIGWALTQFFAAVREAERMGLRESWIAAYTTARVETGQWRERARRAEARP